MPCHLSTYGTQNKECTSLDGTIKGEGAHLGSFSILFPERVVFVKFLCLNTLSIFSPLNAALHVVDRILSFILLRRGNLGAFELSFYFTKNIGKWKARHQQEAGGASSSRIQSKHIKNFIFEGCSNFLVAELYSLCVPATQCSTTSTPRLITLEGVKNISSTPRTMPRRQRPQRHQ